MWGIGGEGKTEEVSRQTTSERTQGETNAEANVGSSMLSKILLNNLHVPCTCNRPIEFFKSLSRRDDRRGGGFKRPCKFWMDKGR